MDDTATESKDSKYTTGNTKRIYFENVYFEAGVSTKPFKANLWFYRCTDNDNCVPAGHLYLNETYRKQNNTAADMGVENWSIPINAEDAFLKVTLSLDTMFWETRKEWTFSLNESEASASIEDGAYQLDLRFENYSPNVLFRVKDLPSGFRGIVSRMYESDNDDLKIDLQEGEQYFVAAFNREVYNDTFAIVEIPQSISPLYEHQQLDSTHVYIPLRKSNKLKIPMRRSNSGKESIEIKIISIFNGGQNFEPFCATSEITLDRSNDLSIGCIDTKQTNQRFETTWIPTIDIPYKYNKVEKEEWKLNIFDFETSSKSISKFNFVIPNCEIPENSTNYFVSKETASGIQKANAGLEISCRRCKSIIALSETGKETELEMDGKLTVQYKPESDESIILKAVCKSEEDNYCEFEKNFNMSVLRFASDDGVIDINGNDFIRGVSRQILLKNGTFRIAKTWIGKIEVENTLERAQMNLIYRQSGYNTIVSAKLGEISIPLSASFYQKDPIGFFKALGATTSDFKEGDVEFLSDGRAKIKTSIVDPALANYSAVSGLPEWIIASTDHKWEGLSPLAIGMISAGVILFVALVACIAFIVLYRKRKAIKDDDIVAAQLI